MARGRFDTCVPYLESIAARAAIGPENRRDDSKGQGFDSSALRCNGKPNRLGSGLQIRNWRVRFSLPFLEPWPNGKALAC